MIKTLDELKKIRKKAYAKVALRVHSHTGEKIQVRVGVSDTSLPSGRKTLNALVEDVADEGLDNVKVVLVDNHGDHSVEPIVGINVPGHQPIIYEKVDASKAHEIYEKHIKGGHFH